MRASNPPHLVFLHGLSEQAHKQFLAFEKRFGTHGDTALRVNIYNNATNLRSGYVNVDSARGSLDGLVEAGEATEMVVLDLLDGYAPARQPEVLRHWVSRLAPGGQIAIACGDLYEICRAFVNGAIEEAEAGRLLFGDDHRRATLHSEVTLQEELASLGLEIITRRTEAMRCMITARRPV